MENVTNLDEMVNVFLENVLGIKEEDIKKVVKEKTEVPKPSKAPFTERGTAVTDMLTKAINESNDNITAAIKNVVFIDTEEKDINSVMFTLLDNIDKYTHGELPITFVKTYFENTVIINNGKVVEFDFDNYIEQYLEYQKQQKEKEMKRIRYNNLMKKKQEYENLLKEIESLATELNI